MILLVVAGAGCHVLDREKDGLSKEEILAILALSAKFSCAYSAWIPGGDFLFSRNDQRPVAVPGEVLVTFREGASARLRARSLTGMPEKNRPLTIKGRAIHHVHPGRNETVDEAVDRLRRDPNVLSVQPNFLYHTSNVPADPQFAQQWGLRNTGQTVNSVTGVAGVDIGATVAWNTRTDCSSIVVAVLDTGVNYNQEDLVANMWDDGAGHHGYDFVRNTTNPMDFNRHGTHVAGIIAAASNTTGGVGVCWKAKIMAVRVLDATGAGDTYTIAQGIRWAVDHGAQVINASLGGPAGFWGDVMDQSIAYARDHGVLVVAAAGNDSLSNDVYGSFPANYDQDNIISVASLNSDGSLASYSNYGERCVHVGAPGSNVYSTLAGPTYYNGSTTRQSASSDYFTGWTLDASWGHARQPYGSTNYWEVMNPTATLASPWWTAGLVPNSGRAYRVFNAGAFGEPYVYYYLDYELLPGDSVTFDAGATAGVPNTTVATFTGTSGGRLLLHEHDVMTPCANQPNCSVGFQMHATTGGGTPYGAGVGLFEFIGTDTTSTSTYAYLSGTSMATPYVSGVAALVWAEHPGASYQQIRQAILVGGTSLSSLSGRTMTGRMANAPGALQYLH